MLPITFNGKEVIIEIEHGSYSCVDSFAVNGYYIDNGRELTSYELDEVNDLHCDEIQYYSYTENIELGHYIETD